MSRYIIFDIDGVLADCSHRLHYIQQTPKNWDMLFNPAAVAADKPIMPAALILDGYCLTFGHRNVLFFTGRPERTRDVTTAWLEEHLVGRLNPETLYMRADNDRRNDDILKEEWLLKVGVENVICAFEDRTRIVKMYRKHGVICYQAAEGDF